MRPVRSVPLYGQVRDELARQIAEQKFPAGSVLPNEFVLAEGLGVSVGGELGCGKVEFASSGATTSGSFALRAPGIVDGSTAPPRAAA